MTEQEVLVAAAAPGGRGPRKGPVLGHQGRQCLGASRSVDVEHDQVELSAGADCSTKARGCRPPASELVRVSRCSANPVRDRGASLRNNHDARIHGAGLLPGRSAPKRWSARHVSRACRWTTHGGSR